jgi:hypothetical protein
VGNTVKPARNGCAPTQRTSLARQNKESALKSILGIVLVAENSATNAENHGPMAIDEGSERLLIPIPDKPGKELPIGVSCTCLPPRQAARMIHDIA